MRFRKRKKIRFAFIARDLSAELLTREKTANQGKLDTDNGMGNRSVRLTVTGYLEGETAKREFEATVLQEAKKTVVKSIRPVVITGEPGSVPALPSVVIVTCEDGRVTTMPVKWDEVPAVPAEGERKVYGRLSEGEQKTSGRPAETVLRAEAVLRAGRPEEEKPERQLEYFPLSDVRLLDGSVYAEAQQRMNEYLLSVDDDQMLYNFRKACGLSVKGAPPMTGWDEDSCKLKGHTTGHYLSGLALAWAATGDPRFREKIDYIVASLAECQQAFALSGRTKPGFLSAYDEEQFDQLEQFVRYPLIWAPYYTLDKIMSGLYDCCTLAGSEQALEIEAAMGDWVYARLSRLPKQTRDQMWSMYIAGEFGGMIGTMVKLYGLTGREEHLQTAKFFLNEKLFYPMEQGVDTLEDMHGNQHIPQILGAMDLYAATGDPAYWRIGSHFWQIVTEHHAYCVGGVGETEMFHAPDSTCRYLTEKAAESCASYNLLRLTGQLFPYSRDGRMMDYYENTLLNHIMTSASHASDGGTTYFLPLQPGGRKEYSTVENTCCHGTGMESRFRFMEHIYAQDGEYVYVNLPVPSKLSGENALTLAEEEPGRMVMTAENDWNRKLRVHIPAWAEEKVSVSLCGRQLEVVRKPAGERGAAAGHGIGAEQGAAVIRADSEEPGAAVIRADFAEPGTAVLYGGYIELPGRLSAGDTVEIRLPMELRVLENRSDRSLVNLAFGPYILAELSEETHFLQVPDLSVVNRAAGLTFYAGTRKMIPLARVDREAYHIYYTAICDRGI